MCCNCDKSGDDSPDYAHIIGMDDAREENREYANSQPFNYLDFAISNARREFTPEMFNDDDEGIAA